jgi:hypothetical protein
MKTSIELLEEQGNANYNGLNKIFNLAVDTAEGGIIQTVFVYEDRRLEHNLEEVTDFVLDKLSTLYGGVLFVQDEAQEMGLFDVSDIKDWEDYGSFCHDHCFVVFDDSIDSDFEELEVSDISEKLDVFQNMMTVDQSSVLQWQYLRFNCLTRIDLY